MTEQETEVWAARLARIWNILSPFIVEVDTSAGPGRLIAQFAAPLSPSVQLGVDIISGYFLYSLYDLVSIKTLDAFLRCEGDERSIWPSFFPKNWGDPPPQFIRQLQSQWMPIFRRGLWLSGLPIEASAHEKMEWMQGFTREEIEAWNLKF